MLHFITDNMQTVKEALEKKKNELVQEFEVNRKRAQILMQQKQLVDQELEGLVNLGSLNTAKIEAINEMLEE